VVSHQLAVRSKAPVRPVAYLTDLAMSPLLLLLVASLAADAFTDHLNLVILHNNDMHGRFEETSRNSGTCKDKTGPRPGRDGCVGGFARTAHEIRRYRKLAAEGRGRPVLYLNAGDTYVGTSWFAVHKWRITAEFLNALRPDAMCLGNHEFDFGVSALAPFVDAAEFPIVSANLNFDKEPSLKKVNKSVVLEIANRKIGIIGHLIPDTQLMSSPGQVEFLDVVDSVRRESEALDRAGVKIIIVLGHSGYDMDKEVAAKVPLVDVVVGGHTNTFLWNGPQPDQEKPQDVYPKVVVQPSGKKVPVVQAYAYTKYLGVLNVSFNENGDLVGFEGQPEFLDTAIPQDQDILELLETFRPEVEELDKKVVGKSRVLLDATSNKCRSVECNLANLIADSFVFYMAAQYAGPGWTDTPIGIINGGSVRTTIDPSIRGGNVTRGELMGTLPFENQVLSLTLTGAELVKTLEIGARSNGETSKGEFLQASGLHVEYDMSKPSYSRVVSVKARCGQCEVPIYEPVLPERTYNIVTVSFLTGGGDGHTIFRDAPNKKVQDLGDVDTVVWYLERQSPVYPEEQGRIQFVETKEDKSAGGRKFLSPLALLLIVANHLVFNVFGFR
jgi:2',3'-cyclic-nucleotide 2'-phosphodiesterase (5'-nucleotidase family)